MSMTKKELENLTNFGLIELYEDFVKWNHYEATDEFRHLKEMDISYSDVRDEVVRRFRRHL